MSVITNGATIKVVDTGKSYHTHRDWGLAIGNNNCIGMPEQETCYLDVPGSDRVLDYSEALTGRPVFKHRSIEIVLGGKMDRLSWAPFISKIRMLIQGKLVQVVFDDFPGYYWEGRAEVAEYDRKRELGSFIIRIPRADPYGYSLNDNSDENWLWDPLDFEFGVIDEPVIVELTAQNPRASRSISHGAVPFVAEIFVKSIGPDGLTMTVDGDKYILRPGVNSTAALLVDKKDLVLGFSGTGSLQIIYRRRVL